MENTSTFIYELEQFLDDLDELTPGNPKEARVEEYDVVNPQASIPERPTMPELPMKPGYENKYRQ